MTAPYLGGCLCGAIRYRITSEPLTLYACHCTECQRRTGSAFALSMLVASSAVELTSGAPSPYHAALPDGRVKRGKLCAACGTRLWGEPAKRPGVFVVQPGTLDDTSWLKPVAHIWASEAQPWFAFPEGVRVYQTQPEDRLELVRLWQGNTAA
jgi:hypothetical protein